MSTEGRVRGGRKGQQLNMKPAQRIAVGSVFTECNQFGGMIIDMSWFERYELLRGDELLRAHSGVLGGMLEVLREHETDVVPLAYASTCPGGLLSSDCYAKLKAEILDALSAAAPVHGVLLPLHGGAAAEDVDDVEGDLISSVREVVGPSVPLVATLDLHAHVTSAMVAGADALLGWETYPHRDAFSTGERGARLLLDIIEGRCRPTMAMAKVPVITSAIRASTEDDGLFARTMRFAKEREGKGGIVSTSVFLAHFPLDQPDLGGGGLVVANDDMDAAVSLARQIAEQYWTGRFELEPETCTADQAVARGLAVEGGPVVLVEAADCIGGGAAGDSVASLRALLAAGVEETSLVPVVDPLAAAECQRAGAGSEVTLDLGHRCDPRWGSPIRVTGRVTRLSDGRFRYTGGIWDGVEGKMGTSAVLSVGAVQVLVTTYATYDWMDEQFGSVQLNPASSKFIVAKNPMNYRRAYGGMAKAIFILDTPGPTPPTVKHLSYKRLERPYFPLDEDIPGLTPTILK